MVSEKHRQLCFVWETVQLAKLVSTACSALSFMNNYFTSLKEPTLFYGSKGDPLTKSIGRKGLKMKAACRSENCCPSGESWHCGSMRSPALALVPESESVMSLRPIQT